MRRISRATILWQTAGTSCISHIERTSAREKTMSGSIGESVRARLPYEPIHRRRKLALPGNARVAVWTIVNSENWAPAGPMPRAVLPPPMGQPLVPDIPNWAWHEYGMRVGFWRFLESLQDRGLKASLRSMAHAARFIRKLARRLIKLDGTSWAMASCRSRCTA